MTPEEKEFREAIKELSRTINEMMEKTQEVFVVAERSRVLLEDTMSDIKNWKPKQGISV